MNFKNCDYLTIKRYFGQTVTTNNETIIYMQVTSFIYVYLPRRESGVSRCIYACACENFC